MLLAQFITAILLWLSACSGFVDPPPVDPPDTLAAEPPGNHAPELRPEAPDFYFVTAVGIPIVGTHATSSLLARMIDPDGDPMTALIDSMPFHGTLNVNSDGTWEYDPDPGYTGGDRFYFKAADPWRSSETVFVAIFVNTQPIARPDTLAVVAGDTLKFTPNDLLANDFDVNGHILFPIIYDAPAHGQLLDDPTTPAQLLYIPEPGFTGTDAFHYYAEESDGSGAASEPTTVTIVVEPTQ